MSGLSNHPATPVDADTQPMGARPSVPPLATAVSLGHDCPEPEEEGTAPNFNSAFRRRPLGLQPHQLAPDTAQSEVDLLDRDLQLEGPHQPHLPLSLNLGHLSELQASFAPTESRGTISSSSHHSASIASGSAPSLGRAKKPCTSRRHGSKTAGSASQPDMSNLRSWPLGYQEILRIAKLTFIAETFKTGLLWPHQASCRSAAYAELALEAVSQGNALAAPPGSTGAGVVLDKTVSQMLCTALSAIKGEVKTMAQPLVQATYGVGHWDPAQVELGVSIVDQIKQRVSDLTLTKPGPTHGLNAMAFTDGKLDANRQPGVYNNKCCQEIVAFALFKKASSPGHKYPKNYGPPFSLSMLAFGFTIIRNCLEEWKEGVHKEVHLESRVYDRVYEDILNDMQVADSEEYYRRVLLNTRTAWWNQAISYYGVANNSEPHAGGYRKFLPQVASASELTTSQRATVTPQIAASMPTPAIAYAASQTELPAPAASNSLLGSALLDQQYNRGDNFNPYGWVGSSDSLGWEYPQGLASTSTDQVFSGLNPSFTLPTTPPTYLDPEAETWWGPETQG